MQPALLHLRVICTKWAQASEEAIIIYPEPFATQPEATVLAAVRCWRSARDAHRPVQPCLSTALRPRDCEMLAPCFDSLLSLAETALGRAFVVAEGASLSEDESLLLDLLAGGRSAQVCLGCPRGIDKALDCALCSTRILLALAGAETPPRGRPQ